MDFATTPFHIFKSLSYNFFPTRHSSILNQKNSPPIQHSTTITNLNQNVTSSPTSKNLKQNVASSSTSKNLNQNVASSSISKNLNQNVASSSTSKNLNQNLASSSTSKNLNQNATTSKIASKIKLVKNLESPRKRYNKLIAFGDSFTDTGNVYNLTNKQWPSEINYKGRFCNGKVWAEYLAESLNVELVNYAFGGATADSGFIQGSTGPNKHKVPGIKQQIEAFISANTKSKKSLNHNLKLDKLQSYFKKNANPKILKKLLKKKSLKKSNQNDFGKTLFAVWDTGNDYYFTDMTAKPLLVVQSLIDALHLLVKSFPTISTLLIPNLPDLSRVPYFKTMNAVEKEKLSKLVDSHNKHLLEHLVKFSRETGVKIVYLKCDKFFVALQTDTGMNSFGITNCVDAAFDIYGADEKKSDDIKLPLNVDSLDVDDIFNIVLSKSSNSDISLQPDHKVEAVYNQSDSQTDKDSYFYFDDFHYSSKVHESMANVCFETLENSIYSNSRNKRNSFAAKMFGMVLGDYMQ
ncbi:8819_t:CDS:2 [Dentiscutata erythropus]|uniref:8819_t:CDS:1 n=1 Tax=Dentiscutata erythropus TaxID=1348616 RepID=A0A9N9EPZ3_9GLOM|nr:8819_t:CDS:2 [Dentiscutata erythropus]